jgi:hypothetical protein
MEDDLNFLETGNGEMEDNLNLKKLEDDLNLKEIGRQPLFKSKGKTT